MIAWKLEERYARAEGRLFLTGTQALVKLPLLQRLIDERAGLNTAGFISGYRGSPLGNFDSALWAAKAQLEAARVVFRPGVNEDLAATSVLGTQQANIMPVGAKYDGVFAMWYGKGPGVDRSIDALRHGNMHGTSLNGGVLVLAGDDHGGKSSTVAHQSDQALMAAGIPVISPASLGDYLRLGLWGWAMSRATGVWTGFKCVTETVESSGTVDFALADGSFIVPDGLIDPRFRQPLPTLAVVAEEDAFLRHRLAAVLPFARANPIDREVIAPANKRLGIVAVGKACGDVRQALSDLQLSPEHAAALGIGLYEIQLAWPLETQGMTAFARGYDEILIVEEKRAFVELQIKDALFHLASDERPRVSGKRDPAGARLQQEAGELSPSNVRLTLLARLAVCGIEDPALAACAAKIDAAEGEALSRNLLIAIRTPAFCSGCPHNSSTKIPEGSYALSGIGCHTMAVYMPDRPTGRPTQMGGEGANWIGMAPFVEREHIFQNLGDGTYFHSGLLAVRAAVAAGVNVTYKLLFNDAVAMTGGQPIDGDQTVDSIARQLLAEGVSPVVVVTDDIGRYPSGSLPAGVEAHDRGKLIAIEQRLRAVKGVSAIIYEQTCAAEKRRRRKQGQFPDPPKRYFINPEVCEGCGDCGVQSNCVSLSPLPTMFGTKRRIDQASCNKDYSCVQGFCPSFVTVLGGSLRRGGDDLVEAMPDLPMPVFAEITGTHDILIAGIGGTGVVTVGAILGMAAHLSGLSVSLLDLTGLSQKNGAVASHVRIARTQAALGATRIGIAEADALIACDLLVAAAPDIRKCVSPETQVALNSHFVAVAAFQQARDMDHGTGAALEWLGNASAYDLGGYDATTHAERRFGNAALANIMLLGTAWQKAMVPLPLEAIERAITLNGVAIPANLAAFHEGRRLAVEGVPDAPESNAPPTIQDVIAGYKDRLTGFQDTAYADAYLEFVAKVAKCEGEATPGSTTFSEAVARNLGKLMAYKDEYEVARLHHTALLPALEAQFEGEYKLRFNLAPPLFAERDPVTGHLKKREFGGWMGGALGLLARGKRLRGTPFDPFGYTAERKHERALIRKYRAVIVGLLSTLSPESYARAVEIASLPDSIRGFGHVKDAAIEAYEARLAELLATPAERSRELKPA